MLLWSPTFEKMIEGTFLVVNFNNQRSRHTYKIVNKKIVRGYYNILKTKNIYEINNNFEIILQSSRINMEVFLLHFV